MSAALTIGDALMAALEADALLTAALGADAEYSHLYSGRAPEDDPFPRIVLGLSTENERGTFGRGGTEGTEQLHIWTAGPEKRPVLVLYAHVYRILHGVPLTLTDHTHIKGRVSLITTMVDPSNTAHHGVVAYRVATQAGAA